MAKAAASAGKLTRIKSALKRWPSMGKLARANSNVRLHDCAAVAGEGDDHHHNHHHHHEAVKVYGGGCDGGGDLRPVYVGRSRRQYLVGPEVMGHPVFQELVQRSGEEADGVNVACEVVLFEHLLWMMENAAAEGHLESAADLADFYAC